MATAWVNKYCDLDRADPPLSGDGSIGNPWTWENAIASAAANDYVWCKADSGGDTISSTGNLLGSGSITSHTYIAFHAYNTTPGDVTTGDFSGDMDPGGAFYQSPLDALQNGVDVTKNGEIDGGGGAYNAITNQGHDNIIFRNFYFQNITLRLIAHQSTPAHCQFYNCKFDNAGNGIGGACQTLSLIDCYFGPGFTSDQLVNDITQFLVNGCVFDIGGVLTGISGGTALIDAHVLNSLFVNGARGIGFGGGPPDSFHTNIIGNTFYNQTEIAAVCGNRCEGVAYNNIFIPAVGASDIGLTASIASMYEDYNCYYAVDGALSNPFANGTIGENSIEVDPLFIDAANDDFRLKANSPCLNVALPGVGSGFSNMGSWQRKSFLGVR